ncbi:MAG TPA: TetR/AcrR family transcriptional regulator, partial [Armatimonadota bacterium]|nr:TetR/AcrR family transcriptional regulator [Armatimonadota bacterium]
ILEAAVREFSDKGFHGARVDVIATAAGVNKQRIYAYFANKETLFSEVIRHIFTLIGDEEALFLDLGDDDAPHMSEILLRHYMFFHARVPEFWRLLAWENLESGRHAHVLKDVRETAFAHLRRIYHAGQRTGIFHERVSFATYLFVLSAIAFFYYANQRTLSQTLNRDLADPAVREQVIRECLSLLATHDHLASTEAMHQGVSR